MSKETLLSNAYNYYSKCLTLSKGTGDLSLLMICTKSLSETEKLRGNYKSALDFFTTSTLYKDSIFNDENKTKIATLEHERLAEVKNKEIQFPHKHLQFYPLLFVCVYYCAIVLKQ